MRNRISTPGQAIVTGIIIIVFMSILAYNVFPLIIPSGANPVYADAFNWMRLILILLIIILGGWGVTLIGVAIFFVRRRGFAWGDPFYSDVKPRNTTVTKPAYGVERPNQGETKVCPVCEHKVASDSKLCSNCGELFTDLPP